MKRLSIFLLSIITGISLSIPVNAQYSFQDDKPAVQTVATSETPAESDTAEAVSSEENSSETKQDSDTAAESLAPEYATSYGLEDLGNGPDISAESAILMDVASGAVLYEKEAETKRYPASITKVMTTLLAIEKCNMSDIVTFSNAAVNGIEAGSSTAGINVGAQLTVEDTLYALMLVSANEAGAALAEHISGSTEEFAKLMTQRAKELGCTGTNFKNPHGLPDEDHYTTAHDMGLILKEALKHDEFRKIAGADSYTLQKSDTLTNTLELWNHAKILRENSEYYYEPVEGAKTGYTQAALNTLVTYAKKDNVELLCVILKDYGADNSYYDSEDLYEWGFKQVEGITPLTNFDFDEALSQDKSLKDDKLTDIERLGCTFPQDYYILVKKGFDASGLKTSFTLDEDPKAGRMGYINISSGDKLIGSAPVTYDTNTNAAKSYINGEEIDDDLETVPDPDTSDKLTPRKVLNYMLRIAIAFLLIFIIMRFIRAWEAEKRRKNRIAQRRKRRSTDQDSYHPTNSNSEKRKQTTQKKKRRK